MSLPEISQESKAIPSAPTGIPLAPDQYQIALPNVLDAISTLWVLIPKLIDEINRCQIDLEVRHRRIELATDHKIDCQLLFNRQLSSIQREMHLLRDRIQLFLQKIEQIHVELDQGERVFSRKSPDPECRSLHQ